MRDLLECPAIGSQTRRELPLFESSAFFDALLDALLDAFFDALLDTFFDALLDAFFDPFFEGFLPDACPSNVVEFEHTANLHPVEIMKAAYQHFLHQFYNDFSPFEKTLANKLA
jgi:hypothetical protein